MPRYLIVAHETVTNPDLVAKVRQLSAEDAGAEFTLLVPATPVRQLLRRRADDATAEKVARRRAEEAQRLFAREGLELIDAHVGAPDPVDAVDAELQAGPGYDGFVVSTLPREKSTWLRRELPRTLRERYQKPVHHVELSVDQLDYVLP